MFVFICKFIRRRTFIISGLALFVLSGLISRPGYAYDKDAESNADNPLVAMVASVNDVPVDDVNNDVYKEAVKVTALAFGSKCRIGGMVAISAVFSLPQGLNLWLVSKNHVTAIAAMFGTWPLGFTSLFGCLQPEKYTSLYGKKGTFQVWGVLGVSVLITIPFTLADAITSGKALESVSCIIQEDPDTYIECQTQTNNFTYEGCKKHIVLPICSAVEDKSGTPGNVNSTIPCDETKRAFFEVASNRLNSTKIDSMLPKNSTTTILAGKEECVSKSEFLCFLGAMVFLLHSLAIQ